MTEGREMNESEELACMQAYSMIERKPTVLSLMRSNTLRRQPGNGAGPVAGQQACLAFGEAERHRRMRWTRTHAHTTSKVHSRVTALAHFGLRRSRLALLSLPVLSPSAFHARLLHALNLGFLHTDTRTARYTRDTRPMTSAGYNPQMPGGGEEDSSQVLEYYSGFPGAKTTVSRMSSGSSYSTTSSSGEHTTGTGSLRMSPISPRGSTHRRVQIMGIKDSTDAALLLPADLAHQLQVETSNSMSSNTAGRTRPTSCLPVPASAAAASFPTRRFYHSRSRSDGPMTAILSSTVKFPQDDSGSEYSDDMPASDDASSSVSQSRPGLSPLTPADAHGPVLVGIVSKDLAIHGPDFMSHAPAVHSAVGPPPLLRINANQPATSGPPPRPPRSRPTTPSPAQSRRASLDMGPVPVLVRASSDSSAASSGSRGSPAAQARDDTTDHSSSPAHRMAHARLALDDARSSLTSSSSPSSPATAPAPGSARSHHSREGAFPPSAFLHHVQRSLPQRSPVSPGTFSATPAALEDLVIALDNDPQTPTSATKAAEESTRTPRGAQLRRDKTLPKIKREDSDESSPSPSARSLRRHSEMPLPSRSNSSGLDVPSSSVGSSNKHHSMDLHPTASGSRLSLSPTPSASSSRDNLPEIPQHERTKAYPRTPSSMSMASASAITHISTFDSTRTITGKRKRRTGRGDLYPPSMLFQDILKRKTPVERSGAYAKRMTDLMDDSSGLDEWVLFMRNRQKCASSSLSSRSRERGIDGPVWLPVPVPTIQLPPADPTPLRSVAAPSHHQHHSHHDGSVLTPLARHFTGASVSSEATFPIRADSSVAVNLMPDVDTDLSPPTGPPALPYPALANGPIRPPPNFLASPISTTSLTIGGSGSSGGGGGGFFASIGRKTSIGKKTLRDRERDGPARLVSHRGPAAPPMPRPIRLAAAPSIPGGPRAPGPRVMRSHTLAGDLAKRANGTGPGSPLGARPPLSSAAGILAANNSPQSGYTPTSGYIPTPASPGYANGYAHATSAMNDAFTRSLNEMSDVLPQVDRPTLARYLRRADGRKIDAISSYMADEKSGRVERG